jgi:hypothetical protein
LRQVPLDMLQLHGQETARAGESRRFGKPVKDWSPPLPIWKRRFDGAADWLLFDAKARRRWLTPCRAATRSA